MATYKVIQDIEAEDKLLWNLSFRQFIYALIAVLMIYISYLAYTKGVSFILVITLPISLFAGFLAFPFGRDQPTEVWAVAKLRFFIKPRIRIWAQSGVKELVTITVPKKIEIVRTDGLSQTEVKSRLQALANTIDSRGWVVKNMSNVYQSPLSQPDSDRLIDTSTIPEDVPEAEDVMDLNTSPIARQMDQLLSANGNLHRQQLLETLGHIQATAPTSQPQAVVQTPTALPVTPAQTTPVATQQPIEPLIDETELDNRLKSLNDTQHISLNHMRSLKPQSHDGQAPLHPQAVTSATNAAKQPPTAQAQASTPTPDPDILNLAHRNDLNVTVIAHEANKVRQAKKASDGEVLISLH